MSDAIIEIENNEILIISSGQQGPPGVAGADGTPGSGGVEYVAVNSAQALSGHKAVRLSATGAVYASNDDDLNSLSICIGITQGSSILNAISNIQTAGSMIELGWNWDINLPLYLGTNGNLTQTPPVTGYTKEIATVISTTEILIRIQTSIEGI